MKYYRVSGESRDKLIAEEAISRTVYKTWDALMRSVKAKSMFYRGGAYRRPVGFGFAKPPDAKNWREDKKNPGCWIPRANTPVAKRLRELDCCKLSALAVDLANLHEMKVIGMSFALPGAAVAVIHGQTPDKTDVFVAIADEWSIRKKDFTRVPDTDVEKHFR